METKKSHSLTNCFILREYFIMVVHAFPTFIICLLNVSIAAEKQICLLHCLNFLCLVAEKVWLHFRFETK